MLCRIGDVAKFCQSVKPLFWNVSFAQNGESKLTITSLNSHCPHQEPQPKMLKRKKVEPKTPHFLSLNQDIVAWSQKVKCGLKYVMQTPRKIVGESTY